MFLTALFPRTIRCITLRKALLLTLAVIVNGGCVHQAMDTAVSSWQKQPAADVIAAWGPPSEELKLEGKRLLLWNSYRTPPASTGPKPPPDCVRLLEVDKRARIIAGSWEGDDCPGYFSGWRR